MKHATITNPVHQHLTRDFVAVAREWAGSKILVSDRRLAIETGTRQLRSGRHEGVDCFAVAFDEFGTTYLLRTGSVVQLLAGE